MRIAMTQRVVENITLHKVTPVAGYPDRWSSYTRPGAVIMVKAHRLELWSKGKVERTWYL